MSSIIRVKKNDNFVVLDKGFLNSKVLSWKAKGILAFMLSKPDDWTFHIDDLMRYATDGNASFRAGFDELKEHGYVKRIRKRNDKGHIYWETVVYEKPHTENKEVDRPHTDLPQVDKPQMEKPQVDNRTLLNNDSTKNELYIYSIFEHWKAVGLTNHREFTQERKSAINARLQSYTVDELKKAIDNYKQVLDSPNHYWTYKWPIEHFMNPRNVERFIDEADPLQNFKDRKRQSKKTNNEYVPMDQRFDPDKDFF